MWAAFMRRRRLDHSTSSAALSAISRPKLKDTTSRTRHPQKVAAQDPSDKWETSGDYPEQKLSGNTLELKYARQYRDLYTRHWWWRAREQAILQVIRQHLGSSSGLRILDVGCGDGLFFDRLAEFGDVEGLELDEGLVNPQGPHRARIRIAPFDTNFRPSECYSLALLLDVLEHIDNPGEALRHAYSLLAPSGTLL